MANWIRQPGRVPIVEFTLFFAWTHAPGSGFAFPCDKDGKVQTEGMHPAGLANYAECLTGKVGGMPISPGVLQDMSRSYWDPGSVRCGCGAEHHLERGDSSCPSCGQWRNACGQALRPPEEWEEPYDED